ncbi:MAG: hypothetical protein H6R40_1407, partial [Gemmatimonadetes bacterium]|nr:hypothetical protein [Gemmatimonadota bacterium]
MDPINRREFGHYSMAALGALAWRHTPALQSRLRVDGRRINAMLE